MTFETWRLLELREPEDPIWNMALDASFLGAESDPASVRTDPASTPVAFSPILRFYRWSRPTLSIGYFQSVEKIARLHDCAAQKICVVRRPTGGGLVRHGFGSNQDGIKDRGHSLDRVRKFHDIPRDLTLSLALPENHPKMAGRVSDSYRAVHTVLLDALQPLFPGLNFSACAAALKPRADRSCFEEPVACDLEYQGTKAVGSSQRRKNGRLLHQTSLQLSGKTWETAAETNFLDITKRIADAFEAAWKIRFFKSDLQASERMLAVRRRELLAASPEWSFTPIFP